MGREPNGNHHEQRSTLLLQQVRLRYRCRSLHHRLHHQPIHLCLVVSQKQAFTPVGKFE